MSFGILKGRLPQSWNPATQGPVWFVFTACGDNEGTPASPTQTRPIQIAPMSGATRVKQLYNQAKQPISGFTIPMVSNYAMGYADLEMTMEGGVGVVMEAGCTDEAGVYHGGSTNACVFPNTAPPTFPIAPVEVRQGNEVVCSGMLTRPFNNVTMWVDGKLCTIYIPGTVPPPISG